MKSALAGYHRAFKFPSVLGVLSLVAGQTMCSSLGIANWGIGAAAAVASAIAFITSHRSSLSFVVAFCFFFAGLGFFQQSILNSSDHNASATIDRFTTGRVKKVTVNGVIGAAPQRTSSGWLFYLHPGASLRSGQESVVSNGSLAVRCFVDPEGETAFLQSSVIGDAMTATGELNELPHDPASGDPNGWLRSRGAVALLRTSSSETKILPASSPRSKFLRFAARVSLSCESAIVSAMPDEESALLIALTLGRTNHLSDAQKLSFRRTGLLHLFSVSGLHTMLVGSILIRILSTIAVEKRWRLLIVGAGILFFAALVGLSSPVIRAGILLMLHELRNEFRRPIEPLSGLAAVAAIMLMISPRMLWQVDFQMTFLCALALVIVSPWSVAIRMVVGRRVGWGRAGNVTISALQTMLTSIAIQLMLLPLFASQFGEVSIVAPLANSLLIPVASLCIIAAFLFLLFVPFGFGISQVGLSVLQAPLVFVDAATHKLALPSLATMQLQAWPLWLTASLYLILAYSPFVRFHSQFHPRRAGWSFLPPVLLVLALVAMQPLFAQSDEKLHVWFLDVGQGDAALFKFPDGSTALIDAGPQRMAWIVPQMIQKRGVDRINVAIATHADEDHIGGLNEVMDKFPTDLLLVGGSLADTNQFRDLAETVEEKYIPVATVERGAELNIAEGRVRVSILHPTPDFIAAGSSTNDASVVTRVDYAGRSILLTGDAARDSEFAMLDSGLSLRADVLKVGHHGSKNSTMNIFLDAVTPPLAVISCGKNNVYGHPAPEVLDRLRTHGVEVLRTDNDGTVHLTIDRFGIIEVEMTRGVDEVLR